MEQNGRVKVLSTTAMIDDLVGQIGQDRIDHVSLINGEIDPHSYELVKGDEEKFLNANLVFYNGLGLEHGASLQYHLQKHPSAFGVGNILYKKHPELILSKNGQIDPHVWMDITMWIEVIDPIVDSLSQVDPQGASGYKQNGEHLKQEMLKVHRVISDKIAAIPPEKRYLVTSHDAFHYFSRQYLGSDTLRCTAPEGLAPD